ncbi:MAG: hypothetical protein NTV34_20585 [Proteobacteria bacterium]|nr:hypothetical protein [Pseudomonadota bacterium]
MTESSTSQESLGSQKSQSTQVILDRCPDWANDLIRKIYLLEIETGSISNPKQGQWNTQTQDDLMKIARKLEGTAGTDAEDEADALFGRVAKGLISENFSSEEIAKMINDRIPTGSRLLYCSPSEVLVTLKS